MGIPTTSSGGILFQIADGDVLIVIVEWEEGVPEKFAPILRQLPKGGCKPEETLEQTALREVLEETGYQGEILYKAGEAHWSYQRDNEVWDETVHYYFMNPKSLIPQDHDDEFDNVRWVKIDDAANLLSYPEERALITRVLNSKNLPW